MERPAEWPEAPKKKFVLDTSVLVADPDSIYRFGDNHIILSIVSIEEIDGLKKGERDVAKNARVVSRKIKELCDKYGSLDEPIPINNEGGMLSITTKWSRSAFESSVDLPLDYSHPKLGNDFKIINTAYINNATVVTKDNNLRIFALAYKIPAEDYENEKVDLSGLYTGMCEVESSPENIDEIYANGFLPVENVSDIYPNQCVILKDHGKHSALSTYHAKEKLLVLVKPDKEQKVYEISPKNKEQRFLMELLFNPDVKLLTVTGTAGSGKSLMSVISGLYQTLEQHLYKKVIVTRSPMAIEADVKLGFLPGSLNEKLAPWMGAMYDSIDYAMGKIKTTDKGKTSKRKRKNFDLDDEKDVGIVNGVSELMEYGILEMLSLEHCRGRSIRNSFIIVEEAQNLSHHAVKTLLTRAGDGTKFVLLGDIKQVDAPYLDSSNNGLVNVIEKMKGQSFFGHINLVKSERSLLAEMADKLL